MDISMRLADSYFGMLKSLSNETKLYLIKMLSDSMLNHEDDKTMTAKGKKLEDFFGIWSNDAETEDMIEAIRDNKCSGVTRHVVSLDE